MRRKILLMAMVVMSTVRLMGQASVYHPFPDSGAVWRMQFGELCVVPPPPLVICYSDYQFIEKGDTLINGFTYAKVYREGYWATCAFTPPNNYS